MMTYCVTAVLRWKGLLYMLSHGYTELVKDVTTDRATLIDHVYFSKQSNDVLVQVCGVYYSDHDAVYKAAPRIRVLR